MGLKLLTLEDKKLFEKHASLMREFWECMHDFHKAEYHERY
jgi:hypothetical protein